MKRLAILVLAVLLALVSSLPVLADGTGGGVTPDSPPATSTSTDP
ncbi:MAG: hypothetical protein ACOY93_08675 [Bacillota bacterium]